MTENDTVDGATLYRLMAWLGPSYPVGAFSYSHGLEAAVEDGLVRDRNDLADYVGTVIGQGGGWVDGVLLAHAHRAARAGDIVQLIDIADLAWAFRGTAETALECHQQGDAFVRVTRAAWPTPDATALYQALAEARPGRMLAYPVAVAIAAMDLPLSATLAAFLHAIAANLVSAGVRLVPLGQTDGQHTMAALVEPVEQAARLARETALDDLGTSAPMLEFCSIRHETQYTRLFRS